MSKEYLAIINDDNIGERILDVPEILRYSARAIIFRDDGMIATMHVTKKGYYKLPGGGMEKGEDILQVLHREVLEEVGAKVKVLQEVGKVKEFRTHNLLDEYHEDFTVHISTCYICRLLELAENHLDNFEQEDGFVVEWMGLDEAIKIISNEPPAPDDYNGRFIVEREKVFLEKAKELCEKYGLKPHRTAW